MDSQGGSTATCAKKRFGTLALTAVNQNGTNIAPGRKPTGIVRFATKVQKKMAGVWTYII